ncbi:hypothetical protein HDK64DRAFT_58746 [Phyllosticta capitalensis]
MFVNCSNCCVASLSSIAHLVAEYFWMHSQSTVEHNGLCLFSTFNEQHPNVNLQARVYNEPGPIMLSSADRVLRASDSASIVFSQQLNHNTYPNNHKIIMAAFGGIRTLSSGTASNDFCMHAVDVSRVDIPIEPSLLDFINKEVSFCPVLTQLPNIEQLAFARYLLGRARELHGGQQTSTPGDWLRALNLGLALRAECKCNALSSTPSNSDASGLGISGLPTMGSDSSVQDSFEERYVYEWQNAETNSPNQFRNPFYYTPSIYSQDGDAETIRGSPESTRISPRMVLHRRASSPNTASSATSSSSPSSSSYSACGSASSSSYSNDDDDDAWSGFTWSSSSVSLPSSPITTITTTTTTTQQRPTTASSYARLALIPSFTSTICPTSISPSFFHNANPTYRTVFTPRANDASSLCRFPSAAAWSVAQLSLADVRVGMLGRWVKGRVDRTVGGKVRRGLRRARTEVARLEIGECDGLEGRVSFFAVGF